MDEGLAQTRGYLEEFLPPSWTPQGRLSPSQPGWASRAVFLQPAGSRAHAGGWLYQSCSSQGEAMAPDAMCPGAQKAKPGPGPAPASRATGSAWRALDCFLTPHGKLLP